MTYPIAPLREVASVITKGTTPKTLGRSYSEVGIPFLRGEDIQGWAVNSDNVSLFVDDDTNALLRRSIVLPGDVLITIAGTVGRVGFVPDNSPAMNCNQAVALVRMDRSRVLPEFACIALQSPSAKSAMAVQGTTATITNLSLQQVGSFKIPLPPFDEQRRVVELLNRGAGLKRLAQQAQAKARELIPALFANIFGDPATNPRGWPVVALGDCFAVKGGKRLPAGHDYAEAQTKHPYIRGTDIYAGHIDGSNLRFVDEVTQGSICRYVVADGDVVITIAGKIGVAAPVPTDLVGANLTENAAMIRCLPGVEAVPAFVAAQINSPLVQRQIEALTGRVTVAKLALERIKTLRLFLPDRKVQSDFADKVDAVRSILRLAEGAATLGERTRASLMSRLFAG